jgi:hypothetical protein
MKTKIFLNILLITITILYGCGDKLPATDDFGNSNFTLIDQNNKQVLFPRNVKGKISIVGYIFLLTARIFVRLQQTTCA